ncbi:MAG TPA: CPBP family intramembrane metalloprotease [Thermoproteales archaeon]|nr:CPBP family intramembrane metalloprotease [Thermoproteales archaeon]
MRRKVKAILEVLVFEISFLLLAWYLQASKGSGYGWYSKAIMILLGIVGIFIHGKLREYGLVPHNFKFSLKWGAYTFLVFSLTSLAAIVVSNSMGILRKVNPHLLLIDVIWFFIFVGFAEELFFRGYIQSRLNEVFTRKYEKILGIEFKWSQGTLITGIFFFGLPHLLVAVNPFTGQVTLTPLILIITLFACFIGVILGVIRERTGDIILPTLIHGLIDFTTFGLGRFTGLMISNIATMIALFIFFLTLFEKILLSK